MPLKVKPCVMLDTMGAMAAKPRIWLAQFPKSPPDFCPVRVWDFRFNVFASFGERRSEHRQNRVEVFSPLVPMKLKRQPHHDEWRHGHCREERADHASQVIEVTSQTPHLP